MDLLPGLQSDLFLAGSQTASGLPSDIEWVVAVWFFMIGGCFGSLLNVIVYRWPAGMSIVMPGSRCPRCLHPIRLYDNIPILSWIVLGARCRDCRAPIPLRYPAVETAVAVLFFAFFVVEVIYSGANLPDVSTIDGGPPTTRRPETLWGIYGLHMLLGYVLIGASLIQLDGNKLPAKLIWPPLLVAVFSTALWPELRPAASTSTAIEAWIVAVSFALAGAFAGWIVDAVSARIQRADRQLSATWVGPLVGVVLGWFPLILICFATGSLVLLAHFERFVRLQVRTLPVSAYLTLVTLLFLLYWRLIG